MPAASAAALRASESYGQRALRAPGRYPRVAVGRAWRRVYTERGPEVKGKSHPLPGGGGGQIAALKALGYPHFGIGLHFTLWGLAIALAGCLFDQPPLPRR